MTGTDLSTRPVSGATPGQGRRQLATVSRWLHIYLSMVSFGILFFFAVTGLTLNHAEWFFSDRDNTTRRNGELAASWVAGDGASVFKLEIVEHLRAREKAKGAVGDFRIEPTECTVVFKGPGYSADARIDRATGKYEFSENRFGLIAVLNDLHKARDTGPGWSLVVDLSAGLMIAVSLTGMVLIYFVKRRLASGLLTAAAGCALAAAAYLWLVP